MSLAPFEREAMRLRADAERARQARIERNKASWDRFHAQRELRDLIQQLTASDKPVTAEQRVQVERLVAATQGGNA